VKSTLTIVRDKLIEHLKGKAVKLALKKILGSAMAGGFKAWLVKYIVTELFEEIAQPVINYGFRKFGYQVEVYHGKKLLKKIQNAENDDDWRDLAGRV